MGSSPGSAFPKYEGMQLSVWLHGKKETENIGFFTSHESIGTFTLDLARSSLSGDRDLPASRNKQLGRRSIVCAVTTV